MAAAGGRGRGRRLVLKEEAPKGLEEQHYSRTLDGVVVSQPNGRSRPYVCVCVCVCVCVYVCMYISLCVYIHIYMTVVRSGMEEAAGCKRQGRGDRGWAITTRRNALMK